MRLFRSPDVLILLLLIRLPALGHVSGASPKIDQIVVVGNHLINREAIVAMSGLKVGENLAQNRLAEAEKRIRGTGLFGAQLSNAEEGVKITAEIKDESARVVIQVMENGIIRGFDIRGSGPILPTEIEKLLDPLRNCSLNFLNVQRKVGEIRQLYEQRGFQGFVNEGLELKNDILVIPITVGRIGGIRIDGLDPETYLFIITLLYTQPYTFCNFHYLYKDLRWLKSLGIEPVWPFHQVPGPGPERGSNDLILAVKPHRPLR